jgi:hypothetical protein
MSAASILAAVTPAAIVPLPYAHMGCEAVLPEADYARLADAFPDSATILGGRQGRENSAARLPAFKVLGNNAIAPVWRDFFAFHTSQPFWSDIVRVFGAAIRDALPGIEARAGRPLEQWAAAPRGTGEAADVRLDCQFVINTPTRLASSVKTQHVDKRNTILALLFYFRDPADQAEGGDFEIYAWKRPPRFLPSQRLILPDDLTRQRVVRYAPNTLAAFVNSPRAAHGVSPRGPSELPRRYINFIVETPFKAFDVSEMGFAERILYWPKMRKLGLRSVGDELY